MFAKIDVISSVSDTIKCIMNFGLGENLSNDEIGKV